ncbi:MAG TPA: lysophospholipid acyltransferase family protein [Candidatus Limnocylindria bacterium]|nr:lysophospholipid acyltransferase family protein [Candidatus Limnocylindria bacterium]
MYRLWSWLTTLVFLPAFALVLLVFDGAQRLAYAVSPRAQEYVAGALQWTLVHAFRLTGMRLLVERPASVRPRTPYIIVANHQSMFDIPILGSVFFSNFPKYISKQSLGRGIPSVSYNLRRGGHVLIDRRDGPAAVAAIRELGRRVAAGRCSAMIFPEGTRARRGHLGPFKAAGLMALLEEAPDVPVVPVAIDESWRLLRHNYLPVPWGTRVRVHVGAPIHRRRSEDRRALVEQVREQIDAVLASWRRERVHAEATRPSTTRR